MDSPIDPITLTQVRGALDAALVRHSVHAHNLANAQTPGFRARTVSFQDSFDRAAQEPVLQATNAPVNTATEVAAMAENTLQFQALVRLLNRELSIAAIALNDGTR
jgi:flagellar basal-body rod protein FlgB